MTKTQTANTLSPIATPANQPIHFAPLREAVAVFNGIAQRQWGDRLPTDLDGATVRDHLSAHMAFERAVAQKDVLDRQFASDYDEREAVAQDALRRVKSLVDAWFPRGAPERAVFFPKGKGTHTVTRRLAAVIAGLSLHTIASVPTELQPAGLQKILDGLERATAVPEVDGVRTGNVTVSRQQYELRTREIASRLRSLVKAIVGPKSPRLAEFGISTAPKRAKSKAAAATETKTPAVANAANGLAVVTQPS